MGSHTHFLSKVLHNHGNHQPVIAVPDSVGLDLFRTVSTAPPLPIKREIPPETASSELGRKHRFQLSTGPTCARRRWSGALVVAAGLQGLGRPYELTIYAGDDHPLTQNLADMRAGCARGLRGIADARAAASPAPVCGASASSRRPVAQGVSRGPGPGAPPVQRWYARRT